MVCNNQKYKCKNCTNDKCACNYYKECDCKSESNCCCCND